MNDFEILGYPSRASVGMHDDVPAEAPARPTFEAVYRGGADYVLGTLRALGVPDQDCEDAMHDVFLVVQRRLPEYDPRDKLNAWLAAIARKVALGHRRHRARVPVPVEGAGKLLEKLGATTMDQEHTDAETRAIAQQVFLRLLDEVEDDQRIVYVMHDLQHMPIADIARALEIPVGTVKTRLRLAREKLEAAWKRLEARERGKASLFTVLTLAALEEAARHMPPMPADMKARVWARLQSAPAPSPSLRDVAARITRRAAAALLTGTGRAITHGVVLAVGILIGLLWGQSQRSHPEPQPAAPTAVAPAPDDRPSVAPGAAPSASVALPPDAPTAAAPGGRDAEATERKLMRKAEDALHANNVGLALQAVEEHARIFHGGGRLAETRDAYWITALRRAGRMADAEERLERFAQSYPGSQHLPGLRAGMDVGAGPG
jgi:RNA polymerase sigma factor (sigma-70 family)